MQAPFRIMLYLLYTALAILITSIFIFFTNSEDKNVAGSGTPKEETQVIKPLSPEATEGLKLFKSAGCSNCHDACSKKIGPPLNEVTKKRKREWIHKFVLNSSIMIKQKDPEAVAIYNEYGETEMPSHLFLKPEEIDKIIYYIESASCEQQ